MPKGSSVRSPGSWQGGSWVSALLVIVFAEHLRGILLCDPPVALCVVCFEQDRLICKYWMQYHWSRHTMPASFTWCRFFGCFCLVGFVFGVFCFLFVLFRFGFAKELALLGRILLHFRTPKEGYSECSFVIRSISTTMCDDLARATEAQDGKKKIPPLRPSRLLTRQLCGSGCVCRPEFSIIRLKNNSIYLKPDESFVYREEF